MPLETNRNAWWAGAYPLLLALMLGAVWVDRIYAQALRGANPESVGAAPPNLSDLLLLLAASTVLAGAVAAWVLHGQARVLCMASLAIFCLEFVLPAVASALPGGGIYLQQIGPVLRLGIILGALLLAALAMRKVLP